MGGGTDAHQQRANSNAGGTKMHVIPTVAQRLGPLRMKLCISLSLSGLRHTKRGLVCTPHSRTLIFSLARVAASAIDKRPRSSGSTLRAHMWGVIATKWPV